MVESLHPTKVFFGFYFNRIFDLIRDNTSRKLLGSIFSPGPYLRLFLL